VGSSPAGCRTASSNPFVDLDEIFGWIMHPCLPIKRQPKAVRRRWESHSPSRTEPNREHIVDIDRKERPWDQANRISNQPASGPRSVCFWLIWSPRSHVATGKAHSCSRRISLEIRYFTPDDAYALRGLRRNLAKFNEDPKRNERRSSCKNQPNDIDLWDGFHLCLSPSKRTADDQRCLKISACGPQRAS
jgi:hypothetical protein